MTKMFHNIRHGLDRKIRIRVLVLECLVADNHQLVDMTNNPTMELEAEFR